MHADMERWRSFFAQAEADLWTIIDQAILIAAADFPAEFKHKRCEIAEVLFTRRPLPSPPSRSMEATRLSGSVITNATADGEKGPYQTWMEEVNGSIHLNASRVEVKVADACSHETISKASTIERHILHEDKSVELDRSRQNCNDSRDSPKTDDIAMDSSVLRSVSMIKDQIMDPTNQTEDELLRSLHVLEHLDVNVEILKATDIGREVNKFRKHLSVPIRNLVKQLVRTWKGMVDEWVRNAEVVPPLNASREQEGKARHANLDYEASAQTLLQPSKQPLSKLITDSRSTVRAHRHSEHVIEEMGSSRVESEELYRAGFTERKADWCGHQAQFSRALVTKVRTGDLGPGRPETGIPEAEGVLANNASCEQRKDLEEKYRGYYQGGGSQKSGQGKFMNVSAADHERLETMKRRFPFEDQHAECVKKQWDLPPSSSPELSKRGYLGVRLPAYAKSQHCSQKR